MTYVRLDASEALLYVRGVNIAVRVTPEDAARYRARAKAAGVTLADLARAAWDAPPAPDVPAMLDALDAIAAERVRTRDPMARQALAALAQLRQALR